MGVVEGLTEFLPISSTGHLIIVGSALDFMDKSQRDLFEVVIQLGAILAVCYALRTTIAHMLLNLTSATTRQLCLNLSLAFMPIAILGLLWHGAIKQHLFSSHTVGYALVIGGLIILWVEHRTPKVTTHTLENITPLQAIQIGFLQALALVPGVSRAGATIMGGMWCGLNRVVATQFSFLLAIPVMLSAVGYDTLKNYHVLQTANITAFALGFLMAFLSALLVVKYLLRFVAHHRFDVFAWYRIALGIGVLIWGG